jgi:hypothetical protein
VVARLPGIVDPILVHNFASEKNQFSDFLAFSVDWFHIGSDITLEWE